MIYDVFMFDDEFDMLLCRLYELDGLPVRHIAIEADHTFQGEPKPYRLSEMKERGWFPEVEVVRVGTKDALSEGHTASGSWIAEGSQAAWARERKQRCGADDIIWNQTQPDDLLLIGDLDEIPRRRTVEYYDGGCAAIPMVLLIYSTIWHLAEPGYWAGTVITRRRDLRQRDSLAVRDSRVMLTPATAAPSWHLTWFGTPEDRERKLSHFSHTELRRKVTGLVGTELPRSHLHVDGRPLTRWDGDLPRWVTDGKAPEHWTREW